MWPARTIIPGPDGSPKLYRYYLIGRGNTRGLFLHHFVSSDSAKELHDHPWAWGIGLILLGGYREVRRRADGRLQSRWFGRGRLNIIRGADVHRVELLNNRPAWTLFLHGPVVKRWGFLDLTTERFQYWTPPSVTDDVTI